MNKKLKLDIDAAMQNDPAARSRFEVRLTYSGIKALIAYRRANWFYRHGFKLLARIITDDEAGTQFIGVDMQKYYALKMKYTATTDEPPKGE